jgi:hypothetical protein
MNDEIKIDQSVGAKAVLHRNLPLEVNSVLILVCALLIGLLLSLALSQQGFGFYVSLAPSAVLVGVSLVWALLLKQGKPPAYDVDFFSTRILGKKSWEPDFKKLELEHFTK